MTDMIAAEPAVARRILASQASPDSQAAALATAIAHGRPGRRAGRRHRLRHVRARGARARSRSCARPCARPACRVPARSPRRRSSSSLDPPADALVIGVSHEGGTTATNAALAAARDAGAQTALLTVSRRSPGAALADLVVETDELDQSWCHTVGYVEPDAGRGGRRRRTCPGVRSTATRWPRILAGGLDATRPAPSGSPAGFADAEHLIVIASGADRPAGRELGAQGRGGVLAAVGVSATSRRSCTATCRRPAPRRRSC